MMPIVIDTELMKRLKKSVQLVHLFLEQKTELDIIAATDIETILSSLHNTVHVALRRVNEPQNDAPAMPNDVHGGASRG